MVKICNKLSELLCSEPVPELLIAYYTTLVESINVLAPNAVSGTQLQALSKAVNANMIEIYNRIKERDDAEDEYTEDVEEDEEEYTDEELLDEINKVIAVVLKNVKSNFLETLQILGPTISSFINDENTTVKFVDCPLSVIYWSIVGQIRFLSKKCSLK